MSATARDCSTTQIWPLVINQGAAGDQKKNYNTNFSLEHIVSMNGFMRRTADVTPRIAVAKALHLINNASWNLSRYMLLLPRLQVCVGFIIECQRIQENCKRCVMRSHVITLADPIASPALEG